MIELLLLIGAAGGIRETAKRRASSGWLFVIAAILGFFVLGGIGLALFGEGPHYFFSWGWVGICYWSVFIFTGGGMRHSDSWQCPECRFHHDPTALLCPCGYQHPVAAESDDQRSSTKLRLVAAAMMWGTTSATTLIWASLVNFVMRRIQEVAVATDRLYPGIVEGLQLNSPRFREGFFSGIQNLTDPKLAINAVGSLGLVGLILVGLASVYVLAKADLRAQSLFGCTLFALLIALPTMVGLGVAPLKIRAVFSMMENARSHDPGLMGLGFSEAFGPFFFGVVLGVPLLLVFAGLFLRQRPR